MQITLAEGAINGNLQATRSAIGATEIVIGSCFSGHCFPEACGPEWMLLLRAFWDRVAQGWRGGSLAIFDRKIKEGMAGLW